MNALQPASSWEHSADFTESRPAANSPFGHPYYRYSVVPGGVHSADELQRALRNDDVVKVHYADFNADRAHVVTLESDRVAYVSYRVGDRVYWTRHPIRLRKGETLLTDGTHLARTRCGNRVSDRPTAAHADFEPDEKAFNVPSAITVHPPAITTAKLDVPADLPVELASLPGIPPYLSPLAAGLLPKQESVDNYIPTIGNYPAILPGGGGFAAIMPVAFNNTDAPPSAAAVPEPGTMGMTLLVFAGALAIFKRKLHSRVLRSGREVTSEE